LESKPLRVASIGIGWWSDVLADAIKRSGKLEIVACYSRSADKRAAFATKYGCRAAPSYEEILDDPTVEAIINTTPNAVHLETTREAAGAGKHVFLDKPIANTITDARALTKACRDAKVVLALGIHYTDVLEYLVGPIRAVTASLAQLVLPGDNPDVASVVIEHENGALSTLNASYASASENYVMNIYGKEASAYYDLQQGLRWLKRGDTRAEVVACPKNDPIVDELEEFARAARGEGEPEMDGERSTASLGVILAGIRSAKEGRRVEVKEILA
jgi:predicted dehydrogenase